MKSKYEIEVQLSGQNGNVFNLMAIVTRALKDHGVSMDEIAEFKKEVTSSKSYDQALRVMMDWVKVN